MAKDEQQYSAWFGGYIHLAKKCVLQDCNSSAPQIALPHGMSSRHYLYCSSCKMLETQ